MARKEHLDFRQYDVVASTSVMEHAHPVVQFLIAIDADRNTNATVRKKINHFLVEQCGVGSEAEVYLLACFRRFSTSIVNGRTQQGEVEQRLSTKKVTWIFGLSADSRINISIADSAT
ncbi:MAG: hypothetical protein JOZ22_10020, partial [Acidobacteriia bacterium]|nr:hypothetical protein [Terriglobia bacterium]